MKKLSEVLIKDPKLQIEEYQVKGVKYALRSKWCICGDQMGLGKTLQGISLSLVTGSKTAVVCPSSLRYNWENEYNKWSKVTPSILVIGTKDLDADLSLFDVIIMSYDLVARYPHLLEGRDCVLVDECHKVKNIDTARWKGLNKYLEENEPEYVFFMSGTPVTRGITDWYATLSLMDLCPSQTNGLSMGYFFTNYFHFAGHFSKVKKSKIFNPKTKRYTNIKSYSGVRNWEELKKIMVKKYFRRLAKDFLNLEVPVRKDVIIDRNIDEELRKAWEEQGTENPHIMTAKAHSAYLKGGDCGIYVRELLEGGEGPIVIFTDHLNSLAEIKSKLKKYKGVTIQGVTPDKIRQKNVDSFQRGELDYLIATYESGGEGYNLTKARNLVENDLPWDPTLIDQAERRLIRKGQENVVTIHRIIKGSVDENIVKILTRKVEEINKVT